MHHNQEQVYFAGKQKWEPCTLTWYDIEQNPDISAGIYKWLETVVQLQAVNVGHPSTYKRTAQLQVEDGFGNADEEWILYGTWPQSVNWGELDYTNIELLEVEAVMRFDRGIRQCLNNAGQSATSPTC